MLIFVYRTIPTESLLMALYTAGVQVETKACKR